MPVSDVEVRLYERSKENAPLHEQVTALETMQRKTNGDDATEFFSEYEKFARALRASHPLELKKTSADGSFRLERAIKNKSYFIIFFAQLEDEPVYFRYLDFDTSKQIVELAVAMSDEPCRA